MTQTLFSSRQDSELLAIAWSGFDSRPAQWSRLLEILEALDDEKPILGDIRGEIEVAFCGGAELEFGKWPVGTDATAIEALRAGLRDRVPEPLDLVLECQPVTFLEDDSLHAIDWGDDDLFELGPLPLEAVARTPPSPFQQWRIVGGPERSPTQSVLDLRGGFELSEWSQLIILYPSSHFDLWRPERFDGEPNPPGVANAALLRECFERVARRSGGELR